MISHDLAATLVDEGRSIAAAAVASPAVVRCWQTTKFTAAAVTKPVYPTRVLRLCQLFPRGVLAVEAMG